MTDEELLSRLIPAVVDWCAAVRRPLPWRTEPTPYHVWLSEIMLQQTRIEAVIPYYTRFLDQLPDIAALAACEEGRLLKLWEGLGYYSRVRNLQKAARVIMEQHGGELPREASLLRTLPGIGDYTAGAIASIAFGEPEPAVDGNVLRVMMRLRNCRDDVMQPSVRRATAELLRRHYPAGAAAGLLTEGIMELGETVCIPNGEARCRACPLRGLCRACAAGTVAELPVKTPPRARRIEERTVLLLRCGEKAALRRREDSGLLAGLWEFPGLAGTPETADLDGFAAEQGLQILSVADAGSAKHIFTHVEWHMSGLWIDCAAETPGLTWVTPEEIRSSYALPTAFRVYKEKLLRGERSG